jgi:membrane protein
MGWTKNVIIPGFDGIPLYDIAIFFWYGIVNSSLNMRASSFSFNFFLSLFPTIIFIFTLLPYIPVPHLQEELLQLIRNITSDHIYPSVEAVILDTINRPRGGLMPMGFLLALFFSTMGINSLINAFNQTAHDVASRGFFRQQLISLVLVFTVSGIVGIAILLLTIGPLLIDFLVKYGFLTGGALTICLLEGLRWLIIVAMFLFAFSFLYYLGSPRKNKFRFISAGSMLSTILTIAIWLSLRFYLTYFSYYNTLYGSIGTLMIIMIWINFNGLAIIIGFELNASILAGTRQRVRRHGRRFFGWS